MGLEIEKEHRELKWRRTHFSPGQMEERPAVIFVNGIVLRGVLVCKRQVGLHLFVPTCVKLNLPHFSGYPAVQMANMIVKT